MRSTHGENVAGVVTGLLDAMAALVAVAAVSYTDAELRANVIALQQVANQLAAVSAAQARELDLRGLASADGQRHTRDWLGAHTRIASATATATLRRADLLANLPALHAAANAGQVGPDQLRPVTDLARHVGLTRVVPFDQVLARLAATAAPAEMAAACQRIREHLDPDGADPDPHANQRRGLSITRCGSLMHVRGQLDLDGGAAVLTALHAAMTPPGPGETRTTTQRRADALVDLCTQAMTQRRLPTIGGERPHLGLLLTPDTLLTHTPPDGRHTFVHTTPHPDTDPTPDTLPAPRVDAATGVDPVRGIDAATGIDAAKGLDAATGVEAGAVPPAPLPAGPPPPWLTWAGPIPRATAQRLACDCTIWRAILDPATGLPLQVGRAYRLVPHWIRKALHARDRGCRWPGCTAATQWTDAHHLHDWYHGGDTNIENLLLLCRHHHRKVHEGQWQIQLHPQTGEVHVTRPDGAPYELGPSQPWRPRDNLDRAA